jgi:hypothetical protein
MASDSQLILGVGLVPAPDILQVSIVSLQYTAGQYRRFTRKEAS